MIYDIDIYVWEKSVCAVWCVVFCFGCNGVYKKKSHICLFFAYMG